MGIEQQDEFAYSGFHAYVLVEGVSAEPTHPERNLAAFVSELQGMSEPHGPGPVTSVVEVAGGFQALVHLRFPDDDLDGLQTFLATDLWNGVVYSMVVEGPTHTGPLNELMGAKKHVCDVVGLVKVWTETGREREVLGRLGDDLGKAFHGASIVYGGFDILLALEGPHVKNVASAVLRLRNVPGIARTETSFADWRRVPWHPANRAKAKEKAKRKS